MIKNLKLIKYGYQFRLNIIFSFIFLLIGIAGMVYIDIYKVPSIHMLVYCSFLFVVQTASTLMSSNIVKSSPRYKEFCLSFQRTINILGFICSVGLLFIIRIIQADGIKEFGEHIGKELIAAGMEYFIIVLYMVFVYKFFIVSVMLFFASTIIVNVLVNYIMELYNFTFVHGLGLAALFFVLAVILSEIITRALYKVQPSRLAQSASLRRYI